MLSAISASATNVACAEAARSDDSLASPATSADAAAAAAPGAYRSSATGAASSLGLWSPTSNWSAANLAHVWAATSSHVRAVLVPAPGDDQFSGPAFGRAAAAAAAAAPPCTPVQHGPSSRITLEAAGATPHVRSPFVGVPYNVAYCLTLVACALRNSWQTMMTPSHAQMNMVASTPYTPGDPFASPGFAMAYSAQRQQMYMMTPVPGQHTAAPQRAPVTPLHFNHPDLSGCPQPVSVVSPGAMDDAHLAPATPGASARAQQCIVSYIACHNTLLSLTTNYFSALFRSATRFYAVLPVPTGLPGVASNSVSARTKL